ncbi:MAG: hypothetical protein Q7T73_02735 [Beijerinckiaceae bacterium]|nr:hypothetical protein [Beijerinckiaceae bacterium]
MQDLFNRSLVARLATEIDRHRQHVQTTPDRHARLAALKDATKSLDLVSNLARTVALTSSPAFRSGLMGRLGELLSCQAIEELAGSVAWRIDERAIADEIERCGRGDVHLVDRLTRAQRQAVGAEIGPALLVRLLEELKAPLEAALRVERSHKGGRPLSLYRNYVVQELIADYRNRVGCLPSTAKSGPFIDACNDVLIELSIDTKGLEAAIERTSKKLSA